MKMRVAKSEASPLRRSRRLMPSTRSSRSSTKLLSTSIDTSVDFKGGLANPSWTTQLNMTTSTTSWPDLGRPRRDVAQQGAGMASIQTGRTDRRAAATCHRTSTWNGAQQGARSPLSPVGLGSQDGSWRRPSWTPPQLPCLRSWLCSLL